MIVLHFPDPFQKKPERYDIEAKTINEAAAHVTGGSDFTTPTICIIGDEAVLRDQWDEPLPADSVVSFATAPAGPIALIVVAVVAVVAIAVAIVLLTNIPDQGLESTDNGDSVYSLQGQRNQTKLGEPIELSYGRNKRYPTIAAQQYNIYENNEQFLYSLYTLGHGEHDIEEMGYGETDVANFNNVTIQVANPGERVTLFPDNVINSAEARGVTLLPDENYSPALGAVAPSSATGYFEANPPTTKTNKLQLDFVFPRGLYFSNDEGGLNTRSLRFYIFYQQIDDDDNPVGNSEVQAHTATYATTTPQRITIERFVPEGRYQVAVLRSTPEPDEDQHRYGDEMQWGALRAFLPSQQDYGDLTMIAVKAKADHNLNSSSAKKFYAISTRKINGATTRSISAAFRDILTHVEGYGGALPLEHLDMTSIDALDAAGYTFDHVFDRSVTVWQALTTCARLSRAVPMLTGSLITAIQDRPQSFPLAVFSPQNIVRDSFSIEFSLKRDSETDGVKMIYTDPQTFKSESVECLLPGDGGNNLKTVNFFGCSSRDLAFREGLFIRAQEKYARTIIKFTTGLEGLIPEYGSLIKVTHDVPQWSSSGRVLRARHSHLTLSDSYNFTPGIQHKIQFRQKDGTPSAVFDVSPSAGGEVIIEGSTEGLFFLDSQHDLPIYLIGPSEQLGEDVVVSDISPNGDGTVNVAGYVYDARVYANDGADAPPLVVRSLSFPAAAAVEGLEVSQDINDLSLVLVKWSPSLGANRYIVESSTDGTNWVREGETLNTSIILPVRTIGGHSIRVAAVNEDLGPWNTWSGTLGVISDPPELLTGLALLGTFNGLEAVLDWDDVNRAEFYEIEIVDDTNTVSYATHTSQSSEFIYTHTQALADGVQGRSFKVLVRAVNTVGSSPDSELSLSNPKPNIPNNLVSEITDLDANSARVTLRWGIVSGVDLLGYRIWASDTSGFTTTAQNYIHDGPSTVASFIVPKVAGNVPTYYWRVAALDVWDTEDYTISPEQVT